MPLTRDVGANIEHMKAKHKGDPDWPHERIVAASLRGARAAGNTEVRPFKKKGKKKGSEHMMPMKK